MVLHSRFIQQISIHHVLRVLVIVRLVICGKAGKCSLQGCSISFVVVEVGVEIIVAIVGVMCEQFVGVRA